MCIVVVVAPLSWPRYSGTLSHRGVTSSTESRTLRTADGSPVPRWVQVRADREDRADLSGQIEQHVKNNYAQETTNFWRGHSHWISQHVMRRIMLDYVGKHIHGALYTTFVSLRRISLKCSETYSTQCPGLEMM